jgi:hypothetical protein
MQPLTVATSLVAALSLGFAASEYRSSVSSAAPQDAQEMSEEEMMAAWIAAGTPGEHHRALDAFVGTWDTQVSMWMDPSQPAEVSHGKMTNSWIFDGRYLEQKYEGDFGGQAFQGLSLWGYDVVAENYRGLWIDSMSTGFSISAGFASPDGKTFTMLSTHSDPLTGEPAQGEEVIVVEGPDRHTMTAYQIQGDAKVKSMEIVYTRARQ